MTWCALSRLQYEKLFAINILDEVVELPLLLESTVILLNDITLKNNQTKTKPVDYISSNVCICFHFQDVRFSAKYLFKCLQSQAISFSYQCVAVTFTKVAIWIVPFKFCFFNFFFF